MSPARSDAARGRRSLAGDVVVLCYHAVSDDWSDALAVTQEELRAQLQALVGRGYVGATFSDAVLAPPARKTLAVTFDDAYSSVGELAAPILADLGLPGTVYAVSEFGDGTRPLRWPGIEHWHGTRHEGELRCMSWQQLTRLAELGWEIGSHTCSHPRLTQIGDDELARELRDSRAACERALGRPCRSIAYPYGDVDARVVAAAGVAGYECAAGLPTRAAPITPMDWPRVGIYRRDTQRRFALKVSPLTRTARSSLGRVAQRAAQRRMPRR